MAVANDVKTKIDQLVAEVKKEFEQTPPKELGIAFGIALVLCTLYNSMVKDDEDYTIGFTVLLYSVILAASAVVVRVKNNIENRYAWSVVILSAFGIIFGFGSAAALFLGFVPPLINYLRDEVLAKKQ